jgi:hypothetical protein
MLAEKFLLLLETIKFHRDFDGASNSGNSHPDGAPNISSTASFVPFKWPAAK